MPAMAIKRSSSDSCIELHESIVSSSNREHAEQSERKQLTTLEHLVSAYVFPIFLIISFSVGNAALVLCVLTRKGPTELPTFFASTELNILCQYAASTLMFYQCCSHFLYLFINPPGTGGLLLQISQNDSNGMTASFWWIIFQLHKTADCMLHVLGFSLLSFPHRLDHLIAFAKHFAKYQKLCPFVPWDFLDFHVINHLNVGDIIDALAHTASGLVWAGWMSFGLGTLMFPTVRLALFAYLELVAPSIAAWHKKKNDFHFR
uniref:Uncharacterized protein n=1 Tax=Chromera velia CCMP2878 TaxID=1169474 RepID=A0A0G4IEC2_9ALVE|eukprot:Cvel_13697.t1-p1 / transcript=Cvel_13697.t1 / gene=Cvel_13697 / organism=Chromera_velia_CCMP2878 / gene_product=hypothetical protein / transcript_product=hypothetical protein / location=Cvel_scaffold946:46593-47469(-) / protein_length=260 / sequence_SO=supercontig / SO=protein_coding / is_pseudo=false